MEFLSTIKQKGAYMPSERKPRLSERGFGNLLAFGWGVVVAGTLQLTIFLGFHLAKWLSELIQTAGANAMRLPTMPNLVVLLASLAVGTLIVRYAQKQREYWYREVPAGKIVEFSQWYGQYGDTMYICVEGKTRQGKASKSWHKVYTPTFSDEYEMGQYIDFSNR